MTNPIETPPQFSFRKAIPAWSIKNAATMNVLMIAIIVLGGFLLVKGIRRELFPEFALEYIIVSVPYPGATPEDVEETICTRIENQLQSIEDVKKVISSAREGFGSVVLELNSGVKDVNKTRAQVENQVAQLTSFPPPGAENYQVSQFTLQSEVIRLCVLGPKPKDPSGKLTDEEKVKLRQTAEKVRIDLQNFRNKKGQDNISLVEPLSVPSYQIDIEVSQKTLEKYRNELNPAKNLTREAIGAKVRQSNIDTPAGEMKTSSGNVMVRGKNRSKTGDEIGKKKFITNEPGNDIAIEDLANIRDAFVDTANENFINGHPAVVLTIKKTTQEDLVRIANDVREYLERSKTDPNLVLPEGYELTTYFDMSEYVADRLELLRRNALQGFILVFIVLTLFLEMRLAGWVSLGIPISVFGACIALYFNGSSLNMISMFAFIMALGILVDDAIIIGENVYSHRIRGDDHKSAAINGTAEVIPSVTSSVMTTAFAFIPLMFLPGVMGKFIGLMPFTIIAALMFSLFEGFFILPGHLTHKAPRRSKIHYWNFYGILPPPFAFLLVVPFRLFFVRPITYLNRKSTALLAKFIRKVYLPSLRFLLDYPAIALSAGLFIMLGIVGLIAGQHVPFEVFPKADSPQIAASIIFPEGTSEIVTTQATELLEKTIGQINADYKKTHDGKPLLEVTHRMIGKTFSQGPGDPNEATGSHAGCVFIELVDATDRDIDSKEVIKRWREKVGEIPGVDALTIETMEGGPPGKPIECLLQFPESQLRNIKTAVADVEAKLATYDGVSDIKSNLREGKLEYPMRVNQKAKDLGITNDELSRFLRSHYYGVEVQRFTRGRNEVKVMVRAPEDERRNLAQFEQLLIQTSQGEFPLSEITEYKPQEGYSTIHRQDRMRTVTITADVDTAVANGKEIISQLKNNFFAVNTSGKNKVDKDAHGQTFAQRYPGVMVDWAGKEKDLEDTIDGLKIAYPIAFGAIFILLTLEFRSYIQPLMVLMIIPFGLTGAVIGHLLLGFPLTLMSVFGIVALTGVVINDSIVLIDFINHRYRDDGMSIKDAILEAGGQRFRPILLTTLTTVAGLTPLMFETSFQAQFLIPMAVSLCFGLLFGTSLILTLIPVFYYLYVRLVDWHEANRSENEYGEVIGMD